MRPLLLLFSIIVLLGCSKEEAEKASSTLAPRSNPDFEVSMVTDFWSLDGEFYLYFTNQSPNVDPVDFTVYIDDAFVVTVELPFGNAHYQEAYELSVEPGERRIRVVSSSGEAAVEKTITVEGPMFLKASFWYYTEGDPYGPVSPKIELRESGGPPLIL